MPSFINPFRGTDPTAQAIADFGRSMFGDTGAGALRKEQIVAAQRSNTETARLGKMIADDPGGAAAIMGTPLGQAVLLSSGIDPSNFNDLALGGAANQFGATDQRTQNAQIGAGQNFDNTADAFNRKLAEDARQFDQMPIAAVGPDGMPAFATQGNTAGFRPPESDTLFKGRQLGNNWDNLGQTTELQQRALGIAEKTGNQTPKNYLAPDGKIHITYDGTSDAQTGMPLPPGGYMATVQGGAGDTGITNSVTGNLQSEILANKKFIGLADSAIDLATNHPEAFGPVGAIRGVGQELVQTADALFSSLGGEQALAGMQAQVAETGLDKFFPNLYDPNLPKAQSLHYLLVYQGAAALASQSGRSVSDKDVEVWQKIIGDPQALLGSAKNFITKLEMVKAIAQNNLEQAQFTLGNGVGGVDAPPPPLTDGIEAAGQSAGGTPNVTPPAQGGGAEANEGDTVVGPDGQRYVVKNNQLVPL